MDFELTPAVVETIAGLAGIVIPPEEMDSLIAVLANQLGLAAQLRPLDFSEVPPITTLDPRWT
jgi:hypothetical protein